MRSDILYIMRSSKFSITAYIHGGHDDGARMVKDGLQLPESPKTIKNAQGYMLPWIDPVGESTYEQPSSRCRAGSLPEWLH